MPIILILIVLIIVLLIMNIRIVPQSYQYVVEHLGRYKTTWDAGVKFLIPFMDRVAKSVSWPLFLAYLLLLVMIVVAALWTYFFEFKQDKVKQACLVFAADH